ncbi:hypothetical protein Pedsa_0367 [Pseudopedobacter saltans DSM 12145]|uniref:Uncharacterized protein n=1 Tax=Pseudopedobacter saltans (strain ATCC 51119 / DSM 12145 / JCM 21818 / CCUG 39354 / LMG 10337 / NBRC 100064 / NCIMB 13643) TaxID=762903 RepID=F0S532_PSESL|nr:hypothetical protein [Pseudopedobacter saltans]ADY50949.1 hypothetical protein Pedsa_0367 [Pseudopedobacter saltans DSM 12145]
MSKAIVKKRIAFIFLLVFSTKMILSIAPLFVDIDRTTVNAVILQLELENETHETAKDGKAKKAADICSIFDLHLLRIELDIKPKYHIKPRNYVKSFFPAVPTPPPNLS